MNRSRLVFALIAMLINGVVSPIAAAAKSHWSIRGEAKNDELCQAAYKELQKHDPRDLGSCVASVPLALPGMKEVEGWKELDPREHKELFKKIVQYQAMGVRAYFGERPEYAVEKRISDENLEKRYQNFLLVDGHMRVKTLQLFRHPAGFPTSVTYDQPQTLLELRTKWHRTDCPKPPSINDAVGITYITEDLSGPDPRIMDGEASEARNSQLVMYKGSLYVIYTSPGDGMMFARESSHKTLKRLCEIQRQ